MTIKDYYTWLEQKKASKDISAICLKQKNERIREEVSQMLRERIK